MLRLALEYLLVSRVQLSTILFMISKYQRHDHPSLSASMCKIMSKRQKRMFNPTNHQKSRSLNFSQFREVAYCVARTFLTSLALSKLCQTAETIIKSLDLWIFPNSEKSRTACSVPFLTSLILTCWFFLMLVFELILLILCADDVRAIVDPDSNAESQFVSMRM